MQLDTYTQINDMIKEEYQRSCISFDEELKEDKTPEIHVRKYPSAQYKRIKIQPPIRDSNEIQIVEEEEKHQ
jgi:hypothetical protein